jgi:acyl-CoA thioester hydrolase
MNRKAGPSYEITHRVPFHDLDPLQVVWHGNYFKYFELARAGLFDSLGVDLYSTHLVSNIVFPIVRTSTRHMHPLRFRDDFTCRAVLRDARVKIVMDFEIRLVHDNRVCATSRSEQVAVKVPEMELLMGIPRDIREKLGF